MRVIIKYLAIAGIAMKNNLAYAAEVGSRIFFIAVILYIFMQLWKVTYANSSASLMGGLTLTDMIWYLTLTEAMIMSAPRISQRVDVDVRTGALCVQLIKPMSYPLYWLFTTLGERIVRFSVTVVAGGIIAWFLAGAPSNLFAQSAFALLAVPLAFILDFLGDFLVGLCAFWMEDTSGLFLIYSRLTMVLGGMLIPLQLLPEELARFLKNLPFASIVYAPASMFVHPDSATLLQLLAKQTIWVIVFSTVVWLVYRKALQRIAANGG